jgi:hypothetical protein
MLYPMKILSVDQTESMSINCQWWVMKKYTFAGFQTFTKYIHVFNNHHTDISKLFQHSKL